ncbi:MAG: transglutaminase domain-containing protein, partial [Victivallales bacterium]|nr:transglutaminase domain-containing protein [Victivallales bacterium]
SLPLKRIEIRDSVSGTVTSLRKETSDSIRYRWIVRNVPRMFTEPNMPPMYSVVQRLLISTVPEWSDISQWYWNLSKPHIEAVTPAMREKVAELIKHARSPGERIDAIFRFVSQKIRYMGVTTEKEAPGYEPHDAKTTFENKYGVCRDKAALLAAMLRVAGFKAYPVLIMVGPKKDVDVPNPFFNHAITCVEAPNGKYILMDSTDENTRQIFPSYLCDMSFLVAKPKGDKLRVAPIIPASENLMEISTNASINESGVMIAETTLRFSGVNDGAYRGFFAKRKPFERKRFFERIVKKVVPGSKLVEYEIKPENIRDTSRGLKVYLKYIGERTLLKGDGKVMLPLPWMGRTIGIVNFILGKTGLDKRKYPMKTDIACGVRESIKIDLKNAVGAKIAIPDSKPIESKTISWYQNLDLKGTVLLGKSEFLLKAVEFSPKEYLELKSALKSIEYNQRKTPIFHEAGTARIAAGFYADNANSVLLDEKVSYEVKSESSWRIIRTVKRKILSYAGKKSYSELKFPYNPAWESV